MATGHGNSVLEESVRALKLTDPFVAGDSHEAQDLDVVDLLPDHIWHIIFRHLLQPANSAQLQNQENSLEEVSSGGADSSSCALVDLLTARVQHGENNKLYGSAWPLLCASVASKRLLHHVLSFSVSAPLLPHPIVQTLVQF
ncbi:unnamed protein product [Closterium sp. NIES-53]